MKKRNIKSLRLNKKQISNLSDVLLNVNGGISGGHRGCLPTTLRTAKTCVHICQGTTTTVHCGPSNPTI